MHYSTWWVAQISLFCLLLFVIIDHKLTLKNIVNDLGSQGFPSSEASRLGVRLGIPPHKVQELAANNASDCCGLFSDVIDYWLRNDLQQSWQVLADAVCACGYPVVANTLHGELHQGVHTTGVHTSKPQVPRRLTGGVF